MRDVNGKLLADHVFTMHDERNENEEASREMLCATERERSMRL